MWLCRKRVGMQKRRARLNRENMNQHWSTQMRELIGWKREKERKDERHGGYYSLDACTKGAANKNVTIVQTVSFFAKINSQLQG